MFLTKKLAVAAVVGMAAQFGYASTCNPDVNMCSTPVESTHGASPIPEFSPVPFPTTDKSKREIVASSSVTVDGHKYQIGFNNLMRSGDKVGNGVFGLLLDQKGKPVVNELDGSKSISVDNDFSSLLQVGDKLYMVSHFETRPAAMYLTELKQDPKTGKLSAVDTKNIDFSSLGGLWVPCAGSVSPWGTHLGSEEYPSDARKMEEAKSIKEIDDYAKPMVRYFGVNPTTMDLETFRKYFKPYKYGYVNEITVNESGEAVPVKHYSMGRAAIELSYVMPDNKTVYISDDGTNVGLYMYIADKEKDLSAGTLYAAKWEQLNDGNGGSANISWINLGHATDAEIRQDINNNINFSDIFETAKVNSDKSCPTGFTSINTTSGHECLKVKDGMDRVASRLETRRYAALKGATTEFRKEEGMTFDKQHNRFYVAMSSVEKGMENGSKQDIGGYNDIRLPKNKCGAVYGLDVGWDKGIGSQYVVKNMFAVVTGTPHKYAKDSVYANNTCLIEGIANPDNLTFIPNRDTLIIGEDTGSGHQNDAMWSYNINTQKLTRILTTPYGSETTSPYFYPDINGFSYLMSVIQHPYGESDQDQARDKGDTMGYTGYIGPMPAMK